MTPISHVNFDTNVVSTSEIYNGRRDSSGAQNDEINFDVVLAAGTWEIELMHLTTGNTGIYTVQLTGVTVGTIDGYGGTVHNVRNTITGIAVIHTGKKRLKFIMATKNGSSTDYFGHIQHIQLRRTA